MGLEIGVDVMQKFMRGLAGIICFMVFVVPLSGCTNQYGLDPKKPVAITIWHYYNGAQKLAFDDLVNEFNETEGMKNGIIVEAYSQGSVTELTEKILDSANKKVGAEELPDIFAAYVDTAYQIDKLGLVAPLEEYISPKELEEYVPEYIEEGRFDEQKILKILPIAKSTEVLLLNKTDWDKFSLATGAKLENLKTIEGLTETAHRYYDWTDSLTPAPGDGKAFFGRDAMANYFIIGARQLGIELFTVSNEKVEIQIDKNVMKRLWDNFYVPYINGWFTANGKFRSDDAKMGDIIALVGSTSGSAYFPDTVTIDDDHSYPIQAIALEPPVFEEGEAFAVQQGAGMVVIRSDKTREYASTVFLKWFTDSQRNMNFSVASGYLPVKIEANDKTFFENNLKETEDTPMAENLKKSLLAAIDVIGNNTLYTTQAFEGGTQARSVLEYSMIDKANHDLQQIKDMVEKGMPKEEAVALYDNDENFEGWLDELDSRLASAVEK